MLNSRFDRLSPAQLQVAEYVLRNYRDVGFMGVAELARASGVSPAGIVRFATALGFRGYPEFQRAVQGIIRYELRQGERFANSINGGSHQPLWERILVQEAGNLAALQAGLDRRQFRKAVHKLAHAKVVAIVGFRASATLAHYLWYNLRKARANVREFTNPSSVTLEELALAGREGALFVFITFPRYSKELLEMAAFVKRSRFTGIGITNNEISPLVPLCSLTLHAEVTEISFTDFYAAPLALLNALSAEVASVLQRKARERLDLLDDLAAEHGYVLPQGRRFAGKGRTDGTREGTRR
ncbi:MurR/RpiR family transcriptional regulator [bacterium]|nr:MurR/RpiR family transcriptional regulator [bacterium]